MAMCRRRSGNPSAILAAHAGVAPVFIYTPVGTPCGRSKVNAELGIAQLADESFCPVFLRSATAFGYSPRIRFDLVINNLVAWAFTTGQVRLKSDGKSWRPVVHVEDIARAFKCVLAAPRQQVFNRAFNVGRTDQNFRIRDIADIIADHVPGCTVTTAESAGADPRCYRVNCDRLPREVPAFEAQWDVASGARQLYEAYRFHGLTLDAFEGPTYQRLGHLKRRIADGEVDASLRPADDRTGIGAMA